jgi:hypothetical protein
VVMSSLHFVRCQYFCFLLLFLSLSMDASLSNLKWVSSPGITLRFLQFCLYVYQSIYASTIYLCIYLSICHLSSIYYRNYRNFIFMQWILNVCFQPCLLPWASGSFINCFLTPPLKSWWAACA